MSRLRLLSSFILFSGATTLIGCAFDITFGSSFVSWSFRKPAFVPEGVASRSLSYSIEWLLEPVGFFFSTEKLNLNVFAGSSFLPVKLSLGRVLSKKRHHKIEN